MLRISLCLLLTAVLATAVFAQGHRDVQSLQYEFGRPAASVPVAPAVAPCPCEQPVVYAPVERGYCGCMKCCSYCTSYYVPRCYYPAPKVYRPAFVRPVYYAPRYCW